MLQHWLSLPCPNASLRVEWRRQELVAPCSCPQTPIRKCLHRELLLISNPELTSGPFQPCRLKKRSCDGVRPVCSSCSITNEDCVIP